MKNSYLIALLVLLFLLGLALGYVFPEPFQRKEASLSAIKKGTQVTVTSKKDIKAKQTIQAKTIEFSQSLALTEP